MSIDDRTSRLNLPLPNQDNFLEEDVQRLRDALSELDAKVATVDGTGKVPVEQLPAIAITDTFPVNSEAAMLSLDAQPGDVAIRGDVSKSFILMTAPASNVNNWRELVNDAVVRLNPQIRESLRRTYAEAGYNLVSGSFESSGTVSTTNDVLLYEAEGKAYSWGGGLPKSVSVSTPASSGGVSLAGWSDVSNALPSALKPITWTGFSGGAAWDGVTNDNLPYRAAAQSGRKFLMPYGKGNITDFSVGLYAPNFDVLGEAEQIGSLQNPVDDFRPSRTDTKYSKYHETDPASNRWDSTSVSMLIKCPQSGVNPKGNAAALTGYVKAINSEGGDHVGVHGRAEGDTSYDFGTGMGIWGAWLSAVYKPNAASSGKLMKSIIGCEIDVQNDGPHAQRPNPQGIGEMRGLAVGNTGASHLNQAIDVFSTNSGARGRWWTGLHIRTNSIVNRSQVTAEGDVGEAVMLAGAISSATRYGGLKFSKYPYVNAGEGGWFSYGIDFREASFRLQNAIVMGPQHRITWEPETSKGIAVETDGSNVLTIRGYTIAINNSQVLGARQTGIYNMTGTPDGSAKNTETVTLIELARYVKRISDALIYHGMIGPS